MDGPKGVWNWSFRECKRVALPNKNCYNLREVKTEILCPREVI